MQLVDAFCDTYRDAGSEETADEIFTMRRLREYFGAWPLPKTPDPLPPYVNELERRGFAMHTCWDGQPALFCQRQAERAVTVAVEERPSHAVRMLADGHMKSREDFDEEEKKKEDG